MAESSKVDFAVIESYLSKFEGGQVYISKEYWEESIAVICISHPEKKNAISGKMMLDFRKCIQELETWSEGKGLILCGAGENFCSGGDLAFAKASGTSTEAFYMSTMMQDVLNRLRKLPLLSVCVVHGPTLGGGTEISVFCDRILVADNTRYGFVHGRMGIITAWGGGTRLLQLLGERKAMELLLTAKLLNAADCCQIGLADGIVSTGNRMEEAVNWMREHVKHHFSVVQSFKKLALQNSCDCFEKSLIYEKELVSKMWGAEPNRKALNDNIKHVKKMQSDF